MPDGFLTAFRCFHFVDDELLAIPTHRDVILRTLDVTGVRQAVLAFHAVKTLGLGIPPNDSEKEEIPLRHAQMFFFQQRESTRPMTPGFFANVDEATRRR